MTDYCTNHDDYCVLPCVGCEADCPPEFIITGDSEEKEEES